MEHQLPHRAPTTHNRRVWCFFIIGFAITLAMMNLFLLAQPMRIPFQLDGQILKPRICGTHPSSFSWITFMGDSNMRHTFHWWTNQQKRNSSGSQAGSTFGLDRTDLDFGGRWADQEFLMRRIHSGTPVRFSFRFLHGSISEFMHCANHWDMAKVGAPAPHQEDIDKVYNVTGKRPPSPSHDKQELNGTIRPSDYAVWATKHQKPIEGNSAQFETWMSEWKTQNIATPDIVILTQGWGGVPRAEELDSVKYIVQSNPETLFIWSPMYVTDHGEKRYQTYVQTEAFNWTEPNLRMLDLWDMAQHLPNPKSGLVHIPVGGSYMTQAMGRFWSAVKCH